MALLLPLLLLLPILPLLRLQAPVSIILMQMSFAAFTVKACSAFGLLEAEALRWQLVRPFIPLVVGVLGTLYSNIKVLSYSNVETFITFRSSTPLILSICDYLFLGRELPKGRSVASLLVLLVSCAGYTHFDKGFRIEAYGWLCVWYCFIIFDTCYIKWTCDTIVMTNWGRVYYTNLLGSTVLLAVFCFSSGEHEFLRTYQFSHAQVLLLLVSCLMGMCMSHASFLMRSNVSATASVVVGIVCKILSVLINLVIWDQHATPIQLCFLSMALAGGSFFEQAPLRAPKKQQQEASNGHNGSLKQLQNGDAKKQQQPQPQHPGGEKLRQPLLLWMQGGISNGVQKRDARGGGLDTARSGSEEV